MSDVSLATACKALLFRALERLSDWRGNAATVAPLGVPLPPAPAAALWVFASTIGELNAVEPLLRRLDARRGALTLVLITDHAHYRDSYQSRYPHAVVCFTRGAGRDARQLAQHYPPRLLAVAEIPCLPADAPCRFSAAFVLEAKRRSAAAVVLNGWLYGYTPACRMDAIERRLFERDYLRAFDVICVQTDAMRDGLVHAGADARRIAVTGNIKFDAMQRSGWQVAQARSPRLLQNLLDTGRPVVVAGCVTELAEQEMVLGAFAELLPQHTHAVLVLAPRHPEVGERMAALSELLTRHHRRFVFRSKVADGALPAATDCLVLDTMGDLRDFYAAATAAHVGVDHNVLEPLGFGRPVTVLPGWNTTYPSYPVYRMLYDQQALLEATGRAALAAHWQDALAHGEATRCSVERAAAALDASRGAVERHLTALAEPLQRLAPSAGRAA